MHAKDFMTKKVYTARDTDSILKIGKIMAKHDISSVVILDSKKKVIGIMTERDMVRDVLQKKVDYSRPVKEFLTSPVNKVSEEADVVSLSRFLVSNKVKRLVIMKGDKLTGILTQTDILRASLDMIHELNNKLLMWRFNKKSYVERLSKIYAMTETLAARNK